MDSNLLAVLDELVAKAEQPERRHWICKFGRWLNNLSSSERERVQKILDSNLSHAELHRLLCKVVDISRDTIRTHRTGRCTCHQN